jgi:hypothetical protein
MDHECAPHLQPVIANDLTLDVLEEIAKLEDAPLHTGHLLRVPQDETAVSFPHPEQQTERGSLRPDMKILEILRQVPISLWPPARTE